MVTGFLFWWRAAAAPGHIDVLLLLRSRIRRLAPLYLSCVAIIIMVVGIETRWTPSVPPSTLAASLAQWASFGLFGLSDINGLSHTSVLDPALWTLRYEWIFYLVLPGLSFLATPPRLASLAIVLMLLWLIGLPSPFDYITANFLVGMIVAQLVAARPLPRILQSRGYAVAALLPMVGFGLFGDGDFSVLESVCLTPLFTVVAAGNCLFGALASRAARCLGLVSYSTYVLHGVILYVTLALANRLVKVGDLDPMTYWALMLPISAIVVGVSPVSYRWIEYPFLAAPSPAARRRIAVTRG